MAFLLMKSEERPAVVLLALPIRRLSRREPPVFRYAAYLRAACGRARYFATRLPGALSVFVNRLSLTKIGGRTTHTYARRIKILGTSWQKFTRSPILGAIPPTPDGTLCEPGTLRRQSIDTLKSASNSLAPGNTEGPEPGNGNAYSFFRAFLHNTKEIVPGQLDHQQWGDVRFFCVQAIIELP